MQLYFVILSIALLPIYRCISKFIFKNLKHFLSLCVIPCKMNIFKKYLSLFLFLIPFLLFAQNGLIGKNFILCKANPFQYKIKVYVEAVQQSLQIALICCTE